MNSNRSKTSCNGGFTLIELLVVVLVIGILVAVAVPQYQKAVTKSRFATLKNLVKSIADAQEVYYLAHNEYATDFDALDVEMPGGTVAHEYGENETDVEAKQKRQRYYKWGHCYTLSGTVTCQDTRIDMRFSILGVHNGGNRYECTTYNNQDETTIQAQICKEESKAIPRKVTSGGVPIMRYEY